jgi:type 1 fimbriae regulatory protein FimB/type 1 fimbriae regulatory protein FimE
VNRIISRAGELAGLALKVHPHMLRHGCGYALVNQGVDLRKIQMLMGHARIESTIQYTMLDQNQLKGIWE